MRSAKTPTEDLTARARIRDSAIVYFGRHGFQSATVRAIAADAGVSPALVIHHFGSKDGLREACDGYVTDCIDDLTGHASTHLQATDLLDLMSRTPQLTPLVPYTIQAMTEGGEFAARLWDRLVQDAQAYLRAAVAAGKVRPTADAFWPTCSAIMACRYRCAAPYAMWPSSGLTTPSRLWQAASGRGCSSMAEQKLPKLTTRVRFPSPAPGFSPGMPRARPA